MSTDAQITNDWVNQLSIEQLQDELEKRGQDSEGTVSTLRTRLIRFEMDLSSGWNAPRPPTPNRWVVLLEPPEETPMQPDSPTDQSFVQGGGAGADRFGTRPRPQWAFRPVKRRRATPHIIPRPLWMHTS